ncbi:helix-turn-helix domain-containing protein [Subtercola sp. YIM 133946]|uniref:helix-turn-helix domain-containing protein n=1 Tax=Subtercola sp. YIM 133946 TaxID=3118909 RepID=UPI002F95793B
MWLERSGVAEPSDKMILERLSAGVRPVLERTRHTDTHDTASVEVLLDPTTSEADQLGAARRIGLDPSRSARVIAVLGAAGSSDAQNPRRPPRAMRVGNVLAQIVQNDGLDAAEYARAGIGPERELATLAESWRLALLALRFTGDGTPDNPGPMRIAYESLGTLAALAEVTPDAGAAQSDIARLTELEESQPGTLLILQTLVECESLRQAASKLHIHHSTLQARVPRLESALGYVLDPIGRSRLFASLTVRRIRLNDSL